MQKHSEIFTNKHKLLNRIYGFVTLMIKKIKEKQRTPTPLPSELIIRTKSKIPTKPRRLRDHGTDPLFVGYSFTKKEFAHENQRPIGLSINDGMNEDSDDDDDDDDDDDNDDDNNDSRMKNLSNVFSIRQTIRYCNTKEKEVEVDLPEISKKKKKSKQQPTEIIPDRHSVSPRPSTDDSVEFVGGLHIYIYILRKI